MLILIIAATSLLASACTPAHLTAPTVTVPTGESRPASETLPATTHEPQGAPEAQDNECPAPAATDSPPATRIGSSVDGRDINAHRLGRGDRSVLVLGGVHGNEYGADVAEAFLAMLEASPSGIPANATIHVIPCLNPDGRAANTRGNVNGVDLNLNLPTSNWVRDLHSATSAARAGLNGGPFPGSEPENQALLGYLEAHNFDLIISLHSAGGVIDWDGAEAKGIAREMSRICGLPAQQLTVSHYATGTLGQYAQEVLGVPVITIELESRTLGVPLHEALLAAVRGI